MNGSRRCSATACSTIAYIFVMTQPTPAEQQVARQRFRRNLFLVMSVQVVTLIVLWLFQRHFSV